MTRWIVGTSMKFRLLVLVVAAGILALGVVQLRDAQVDALPEFNPPYIEIQTEALGLSAAEVEQLITVPLEADLLNGVAFLDEIRSDSVPGLSSVVLLFQPGTDLFQARQLVQERMTQAHALPNVSKPPVMLEPLSSSSRAMVIPMSSDTLSLVDQSVLARWTIRPRLMGVPGVANVSVFGQRERQLQVQVDPVRLAAKDVELIDVVKTTGNAMWVSPLTFLESSTPGAGGFIDTPNQRLSIRNVSPIVNATSLSQVAVEGKPGLRLGDVATVVEDHQPLIGDGLTRDASGLMLVVEKFPNANTLAVTKGVEDALAELAPGLGGLKIDTAIYRPASFVETAMDNLAVTVLIGLLAAALLIGLFLFSWRAALIAVLTIPVSVLSAMLVLTLFGVEFNLLLVTGLAAALAVVVADAVSDTESIARRLREQREASNGSTSRAAAILRASVRMRGSVVFSTLIVLVALTPIFSLPEGPRDFVAPLVLGFVAAMLAAMLVALVLTPALSLYLLAKAGPAKPPPVTRWLDRRRGEGPARSWPGTATSSGKLALVIGLVLVIAGAAMVPLLSITLMPTLKEPDLLVKFDSAAGTSRPEMSRVVAAATAELRAVPGVSDVGGHVGRALLADQVGDVNGGQLWVRIAPGADYESTVAAVRDVVAGYPGLRGGVTTFLGERTKGVLAGADSDLTVRVYGENADVVNAKADEVAAMLGGIEGVSEPQVLRTAQQPTVQIQVDLAAAQRSGIKPGEVRRTTATLVSGLEVGSIFEQQKVFEVVVWGTPEMRNSVSAVQDMMVDAPNGSQVRLGDVAKVEIASIPSVIQRESVSRYVDVVANVSGRGHGAVTAEVRERLRGVAFPFEHHAEVVGTQGAQRDAYGLLIGVTVLALFGILLLLHAAFGSWKLAALGFFALVAALAGGPVATLAGGGVVSLGTLVGLVAVLALAARLVVTWIRHCQQLVTDGQPFGPELTRRATRECLGPAVAIVAAVALFFAPFVVAGPIAGLELLFPMAITMLGGLVSTLLVVLFVVPALYLASGDQRAEADLGIDEPVKRSDQDELITSGSQA